MRIIYQDPREVKVEDFPASASLEHKAHYLLNYALLAPSGHNTQPWLFQINDDCVKVIFNKNRVLGVVDPDHRESIISCGAAICNFEVAARQFGLQTTVSPGNDRPELLASISLSQGNPATFQEQSLFSAIKTRQTNRSPYTQDEISQSVLDKCIEVSMGYQIQFNHCDDANTKALVADFVMQGDRWQFAQP